MAGARIVSSGLNVGDKVIVDGLQHVRPDALVDAKDVSTKDDGVKPVQVKPAESKPK